MARIVTEANGVSPREGDNYEGAARFGLLDLREPVASADADSKVSQQEFGLAAVQRIAALDLGHHGGISLAQLELMCPSAAAAAAPKKPEGEGDIETESLP